MNQSIIDPTHSYTQGVISSCSILLDWDSKRPPPCARPTQGLGVRRDRAAWWGRGAGGILLHELIHVWDATTWKPLEPSWTPAGHGGHWTAKAEQVGGPRRGGGPQGGGLGATWLALLTSTETVAACLPCSLKVKVRASCLFVRD